MYDIAEAPPAQRGAGACLASCFGKVLDAQEQDGYEPRALMPVGGDVPPERAAGEGRGRGRERSVSRARGRSEQPRGPLATAASSRQATGDGASMRGMRRPKRSTSAGGVRGDAGSEPMQRKRSSDSASARGGGVRKTDAEGARRTAEPPSSSKRSDSSWLKPGQSRDGEEKRSEVSWGTAEDE